jgi:Acetylglutamate semialdehyde dehydrogenase
LKILKKLLKSYFEENIFIDLLNDDSRSDFFSVQRTNKCVLKLLKGHKKDKIIIISLIDNLVKGAAGQATQCFNLSFNIEESTALKL